MKESACVCVLKKENSKWERNESVCEREREKERDREIQQVCVCVCVCARVCVRVWERERADKKERERQIICVWDRERERKKERKRHIMCERDRIQHLCVRVCVCELERKWERVLWSACRIFSKHSFIITHSLHLLELGLSLKGRKFLKKLVLTKKILTLF